MPSAEALRAELSELSAAGVHLVQVRTREPWRAVAVVEALAAAEGLACERWSAAGADLESPLRGAASASKPAVTCLVHPHLLLARDPVAMAHILEAARALPERGGHLVLVTPPGVLLPQEVRGEVAVADLGLPDDADRRAAVPQLLDGLAPEDVERIAAAGGGMTLAEFEAALRRAFVAAPDLPAERVACRVHAAKAEAVRRSETLELLAPLPMDQIGGLGALKGWLRKRARCYAPEARAAGVEPPRGIALVGPPGTGKSAAARAAADALGLPLARLDVGRVFGAYVGQSEARLREALATVEAMAPCVLMVDEVDKALAGGGGDSGVGRRVLGGLLTWMQEVRGVFVVFTANWPQHLPAELLRRGRLDEVWAVGVPGPEERREVLRIHLARRGRGEPPGMEEAVVASDGYVPAELEAAVRDALVEAYAEEKVLTGGMIAEEVRAMVPLSRSHATQFEAMARWAAENARAAA